MNNLKLFKQFINEGWFSRKTNIEKVQDEEISFNDIDKLKNNIDENLDNFQKYKEAYFNYLDLDNKLSNRYFFLSLEKLFECTINLYRLVKIYIKYSDKNLISKDNLNYYKNNIFKYYGIRINASTSKRISYSEKLLENIYFLNRISFLLDGINKRFTIKSYNNGDAYEVIDNIQETGKKYNI